jgi:hypothetical protein
MHMLPRRGDARSPFVLALTIVFQFLVWWLGVWGPVIVLGAYVYGLTESEFSGWSDVVLGPGVTVFVFVLLSQLARLIVRGLLRGSAITYMFIGIAMLGVAALSGLAGVVLQGSIAAYQIAQAITLLAIGSLTIIVAFRGPRRSNGQSSS